MIPPSTPHPAQRLTPLPHTRPPALLPHSVESASTATKSAAAMSGKTTRRDPDAFSFPAMLATHLLLRWIGDVALDQLFVNFRHQLTTHRNDEDGRPDEEPRELRNLLAPARDELIHRDRNSSPNMGQLTTLHLFSARPAQPSRALRTSRGELRIRFWRKIVASPLAP